MVRIVTLFFIFFVNFAFAQTSEKQDGQGLAEKDLPSLENNAKKPNPVTESKSKLLDSLNAFSAIGRGQSLMFEADQTNSVEKAVESLKSNQIYTPEGANSDDEGVVNKKKNDTAKEDEKISQESEKSYIYLASIIYFGPNNWAVWINKQKFTPKNNSKDAELYLKKVENDKVSILWTLSLSKWRIISGQKSDAVAPKVNDKNQVEVEFELKPNQTFILSQNTVVEGRAVANLMNQRKAAEIKKDGKGK